MLQELNLQELTAIDGGGIGYAIGYAAREVYDFARGFLDGLG